MNIEILESRIAPAAVFTYTDVDGDLVTVKTSKGADNDQLSAIITPYLVSAGTLGGKQLTRIDFSANAVGFNGTDLTITAVPKDLTPGDADPTKSGDGLANIGYIDATSSDGGTSLNLGTVKISGDLGEIAAGASGAAVGVKSLAVGSFGQFGTSTGAPSIQSQINGTLGNLVIKGNLASIVVAGQISSATIGAMVGIASQLIVTGDLGSITVLGDIDRGHIHSTGDAKSITVGGSIIDATLPIDGALGSFKVTGDFVGHTTEAYLKVGASIGSVAIGGSLSGAGANAYISARGKISSVTIGHDLVGGSVADSGKISTTFGADIGSVTIGGTIYGGLADRSGRIESDGALGPVSVKGSILGGFGAHSGSIFAHGALGNVTVGGSVVGGIDRNIDDNVSTSTGVNSGEIVGDASVGMVKIGHDLQGGSGRGSGLVTSSNGRIAGVTIGGSIIGGNGAASGHISADSMGKLMIVGDLLGGVGYHSTSVDVPGKVDSVTIGGSLIGVYDTNPSDGTIDGTSGAALAFGSAGPVKIGGSLLGGSAEDSGSIRIFVGDLASLAIGGSVIGGPSNGQGVSSNSGSISVEGKLGPVTIGGDIRGSDGFSGSSATTTSDTGSIHAKSIVSLTVGGSIVGGKPSANGAVVRSGSINADFDIGPVIVKGSLVNALITATGQEHPTTTTDIALKSLTVSGRVEDTRIALGYDKDQIGQNADAQAGAIKITGDWIASFLIASVNPANQMVGDANDIKLTVGDDLPISKIASIVIGGQILGKAGTNNVYGFGAEQISSFKYNGITVPLKPGASDDRFAVGAAHAVGASLSNANTDGFAVHVFEV